VTNAALTQRGEQLLYCWGGGDRQEGRCKEDRSRNDIIGGGTRRSHPKKKRKREKGGRHKEGREKKCPRFEKG